MDQFDLLKSHIDAYTRKDGAVVSAHDDKRTKKVFTHGNTKHSIESDGKNAKGEDAYSVTAHYAAGDEVVGQAYRGKNGVRTSMSSSVGGTGLDDAVTSHLTEKEEKAPMHRDGDAVKVTGKVNGQGKTGVIQETAPSGHFHIVKHSDGSKASYHESDLSPHDEDDEDGEDGYDEDGDEDHEVLKSHIEAYTRPQ